MKTQLIRCAILCCAVMLASIALTETALAQGDTVLFWNVTAINAIRTAGPSLGALATPRGSRVMAMVHVAMADAVTSIHPAYKPYAIRLVGHGSADQIAAASPAAYGVLVRLFPSQQSISSVRTAEQTNIAQFVTDNPVFQYNRLARLVATAAPKPLEANTRAFAILAMVLADEFISGYDAKFEYNFWRPWTAVQNAAAIGHSELQDSTWFSLIPTPPHPEYTANHAIQSAAVVEVLKYFYGEDVPPVTLTCEAASCPVGFTVTSGHLDDFKTLFGLARIWGGIHYRNSINLGWEQGVQIAQNAIQNFYLHSEGQGEQPEP